MTTKIKQMLYLQKVRHVVAVYVKYQARCNIIMVYASYALFPAHFTHNVSCIPESTYPSLTIVIEPTATSKAELQLQDADFPEYYENMQHPDDYKLVIQPFVECIPHYQAHHNSIIVRVCLQVKEGYVPISFVWDISALTAMYPSKKGHKRL